MRLRVGLVLFATAAVMVAGCSSSDKKSVPPSSAQAGSSTVQVTTSAPPTMANPASFEGPVFYTCVSVGNNIDSGPTISKLDLKSHDLVQIAKFPVGGCEMELATFTDLDAGLVPQRVRTVFSPDFQKMALGPANGKFDVGYYDLSLGHYVNVTEVVAPASGEFDAEPRYSHGAFTEDGHFMFHDDNAETYKYFDTKSMSIVNETKVPEYPTFYKNTVSPPSASYTARICDGEWDVNDKSYIRIVSSDAGRFYGLMPIAAQRPDNCDEGAQRLTPPSNRLLGVISDPTLSNVLFLVNGKDGSNKLYQANLQDPDDPLELKLNGQPLGAYNKPAISMIGWE